MKNLRAITFLSFTLLLSVTTSRLAAEKAASTSALDAAKEIIEKVIGHDNLFSLLQPNEKILIKALTSILEDPNIDEDIKVEIKEMFYTRVEQAKQNIEEDWKDIKVAAALSSIIRILDKVLKGAQMEDLRAWLREVKYSVHTNTIHKLIMGLYPGPFAETTRYTNAYVESLGYTANDWVLNRVAHMFTNIDFVNSSLQMIGADKLPDMAKMYAKRVLIGILAHFTWGLEKYACKYAYTSYSKVRG